MTDKEFMAKKFRIATWAAKRKGFKNFKKGTSGASERSKIAEAIARKLKK
jgi:hypothetical protein